MPLLLMLLLLKEINLKKEKKEKINHLLVLLNSKMKCYLLILWLSNNVIK
jgi:hypothetical protein